MNSVIKPRITEKSLANAKKGVFTFVVRLAATKHQIKESVESLFKVNVTDVKTQRLPKRQVRQRRTGRYRNLPASKKALVKLKDKQTIELFNIKK